MPYCHTLACQRKVPHADQIVGMRVTFVGHPGSQDAVERLANCKIPSKSDVANIFSNEAETYIHVLSSRRSICTVETADQGGPQGFHLIQ